jgi:hypothetical protein
MADNPVPGNLQFTVAEYLDQYKAYLSDLGSVGSRYATANGFYLSVVSALLGILALVEANKALASVQYPVILIVSIFEIAICLNWARAILYYRHLFGAKFSVLRAIEIHLPIQCFAQEYAIIKTHKSYTLTKHEAIVPLLLSGFFILLLLIKTFRH